MVKYIYNIIVPHDQKVKEKIFPDYSFFFMVSKLFKGTRAVLEWEQSKS